MKRWVYVAPDGRQFSVYAPTRLLAIVRLGRPIADVELLERPLAKEPVTLVDWWSR